MGSNDLHPVAREVLVNFAPYDYFRSNKLCCTIAEIEPQRCVNWAIRLASPRILTGSPTPIVIRAVSLAESAIGRCDVGDLTQLDDVATDAWSSNSFDEASPYLHRAAARLAWATICLISHTTGPAFETQQPGVSAAARSHSAFTEMANQSAMAIDLAIGSSNDGRMLIASSFSREMETLTEI